METRKSLTRIRRATIVTLYVTRASLPEPKSRDRIQLLRKSPPAYRLRRQPTRRFCLKTGRRAATQLGCRFRTRNGANPVSACSGRGYRGFGSALVYSSHPVVISLRSSRSRRASLRDSCKVIQGPTVDRLTLYTSLILPISEEMFKEKQNWSAPCSSLVSDVSQADGRERLTARQQT